MPINRTFRCHNGIWYEPQPEVVNGWRAFELLVLVHLNWGGRITEITEEKLVVQTQVLATTDVDTFSGSKEDMLPLVMVAGSYLMTMRDGGDQIVNRAAEALEIMSGGNGIKPLFATMMGGMLVGSQAIKVALIASMNVKDDELARTLAQYSKEDLTVFAYTVLETGVSVQEVLAQFN